MRLTPKTVACAALLALSSCSALDGFLDAEIPVVDQETGEQVGTTTVGDAIADSGEAAGEVASGVVGMLTGNPILGGAVAAAAAGLFAGARRKKKPVPAQADE